MINLGQKLKSGVREMIPVTVFFFITFQLLALTQTLMLEKYGIRTRTFLNATILALVIAKVVLIADHFKVVNRFPNKPLMYNVIWKTAIYFSASFVVRYCEQVFHFWRESSNFAEANRRLVGEIVWPHFWGVQLWLLILLLVYCAVRELVRALGRERVIRMFFGSPDRRPEVPQGER